MVVEGTLVVAVSNLCVKTGLVCSVVECVVMVVVIFVVAWVGEAPVLCTHRERMRARIGRQAHKHGSHTSHASLVPDNRPMMTIYTTNTHVPRL